MNRRLLASLNLDEVEVVLGLAEAAEGDELSSFVKRKEEPRWLCHVIDHRSGKVLACVFGHGQDEVFLKRKVLLEPFGIALCYTDYWGAYLRHLDADGYQSDKRSTQKIGRRDLASCTRIKRLGRKTICFFINPKRKYLD